MIRRFALSMLLCLACSFPPNSQALATLTGLWWDPNESGWGVSLDHQSSFVFATFYIYDEVGQPFWIVGELSAPSGTSPAFVGLIYNATGTPFSRTPFNPTETKGTILGTATLTITDPSHADLSYIVNGVRVDKRIQRQTTVKIVPSLLNVFSQKGCQYDFGGKMPMQIGPRFVMAGSFRCSNLTDGTWSTDDYTEHDGTTISATVIRRIADAAQPVTERWITMISVGNSMDWHYSFPTSPVASLSGLWWNPNESGWGVMFDQQASFVFATFYVYDENGKPFWLASELSASPTTLGAFAGPLYNAAGTPFSRSPFVAADTKVVPLGSAMLAIIDSNHANLTYTVNGTPMVKQIQRQTTKPLSIVGKYTGAFTPGVFGLESADFTITADGSTFTINVTPFVESPCRYIGTASYFGARVALAGTYRCGLIEGVWSTDDLTIVDGDLLIATIKRGPVGGTPVVAERWYGRK